MDSISQEESAKFEQTLANLPARRREILLKLLVGETDDQISESLAIHPGTVRKQISNLCDDFGLKDIEGERRPKRADLITLVAKCKPELLGQNGIAIKDSILQPEQNLSICVSNPFIPIQGLVDNPQLFFGREKEVKRIFETLNSGSSVAIIGERQIGKSSLLMEISRQAKTLLLQPREPIYLNLQDIHDDDDFYQFLCDSVGIDFCKGYRLSRNLQNHRLLLIIDELEKMTWDGFTNNIRGQLRGLAEGMNAPLRLVVAACASLDQLFPDSQDIGMTSPFTGICIEYKLQKWDEATIRELIASRLNSPLLTPDSKNITFSQDEIKQLINDSGGHPQKLMALCYQKFNQYLEKSK
ncbi:MAG: AAA family ATPase [Planktothrix agardhii]|jgi:DNA-binding CsgD family transcriptional regulator|uniref:AAA family ATPase n=1 Tax=Planktothrix agardhii TaxID=1160 RepID=UPI003C5AB9EA